jgi:hypothetical protein
MHTLCQVSRSKLRQSKKMMPLGSPCSSPTAQALWRFRYFRISFQRWSLLKKNKDLAFLLCSISIFPPFWKELSMVQKQFLLPISHREDHSYLPLRIQLESSSFNAKELPRKYGNSPWNIFLDIMSQIIRAKGNGCWNYGNFRLLVAFTRLPQRPCVKDQV